MNKETPVIILHGWGINGLKYKDLKDGLEKKGHAVYAPDLPGFGSNPLKKEALEFDDYIDFVRDYIKNLKVKKIILLGHSFGGRIAIRFTTLYPDLVDKLVLTGASGIPHTLSFKKKFLSAIAKKGKKYLHNSFLRYILYRSIGEMDYYKAGKMRETFKNVHKISILEDLEKIKAPTLLVWGENDTMIPLVDGKLMHEKIAHSQFVVIPDSTHELPYEHPDLFMNVVINFIA